MATRASKRLKAAAGNAVEATAEVVSQTAKRASARKTTTTTTTKTAAKKTTTTTVKKAAKTATTTQSDGDSSPTQEAETTAGDKSSAQAAWGALFSGAAKKTAKSIGGWTRPAKAPALSDELKKKIAAFPTFDGVTSKSTDAKWKLVAWNVNGLRAVLKKDDSIHFRAFAAQEDPDVLCLSEIKIDRNEVEKLEDVLPQYEYQYWSSAAKKGYAGTAIFSKTKPLSVKHEIVVEGDTPEDEGRFLALEFDTFWLVHTYVPNAGQKLDRLSYRTEQWDKAMLKMLKDLEETKPVVWCGDLNVAHREIDIHDPKGNRNKSPGFTDAERESFSEILASGFVDTFRHFHPEQKQYTYWSYRFNARAKNKGWRLDYFVVSQRLLARVHQSFVRDAVTGSDHVPIGLELSA
ncbi:hypothetical protein PINS_up003286 [Pythium insidiosum]|nr:hypothetical protein PINS_up003286 [Pythium insidiosum]